MRHVGMLFAAVFGFYIFIIIANAMVTKPELRPDLVVWVPVILCELIGFYLIYRSK